MSGSNESGMSPVVTAFLTGDSLYGEQGGRSVRFDLPALLAEAVRLTGAIPVPTLPTLTLDTASRTIVQGNVTPGTELAVVTLSAPLPSGVLPVPVPNDNTVTLSSVRNNTTFSVLQGTKATGLGNFPITIGLQVTGSTVVSSTVPFMLTVKAADPTPAPTGQYSVALTNSLGDTWTFSTQGRSPVTQGAAQRYIVDVPKSFAGVASARVVFDAYQQDYGIVVIRNDGAMLLDGGPLRVSIKLYKAGVLTAQKPMDTIHHYTNRTYAIGTPSYPNMPTTAALEQTKRIARYIEGPVLEARLAQYATMRASPTWDTPGDPRGIERFMPNTGASSGIGPTTESQASFLCSRDQRAFDVMIGQAEAATCAPMFLWDKGNNKWLNTDNYICLWTDGRGGTGTPGDYYSSGLTQQIPQPSVTGWTPESAHFPDFFSVPYLLTGREDFRDNAQAAAAWLILNVWAEDPRYSDTPQRGKDGNLLVAGGQVRAAAWNLARIDSAADISDAGSWQRIYFKKVSARNWKWLNDQKAAWTTSQKETYGFIPYFNEEEGGVIRMWQNDYFTEATAQGTRFGNADARALLVWLSNFQKGRVKFLGNDAVTYLARVSDATLTPYGTWAAVKAATVAADQSNGDGWSHSDGEYGQLLVGSLRLIYQELNDTEARDLADQLQAKGAPYTDAAGYLQEAKHRFERTGNP